MCDIKSKIRLRTVDAYLREEQSCQISSRSNLKWRSLRFFEEDRPKKNKTSSDMRSASDLKIQRISAIYTWLFTLIIACTVNNRLMMVADHKLASEVKKCIDWLSYVCMCVYRTVRCSSGRLMSTAPVRTGRRNFFISLTTSSGTWVGRWLVTSWPSLVETTRW